MNMNMNANDFYADKFQTLQNSWIDLLQDFKSLLQRCKNLQSSYTWLLSDVDLMERTCEGRLLDFIITEFHEVGSGAKLWQEHSDAALSGLELMCMNIFNNAGYRLYRAQQTDNSDTSPDLNRCSCGKANEGEI